MNTKYCFQLSIDEMFKYIEENPVTLDTENEEKEQDIIEDYTSFALYK